MYLHERQIGPRPARVVRMARALLTSRPGPARGLGPQAIEKRVKITAGWGGPRHVSFQACREGSVKHCWGSMGVGRALTCFVPEPPSLQKRERKTLLGGSVGLGGAGSQLGADRFIYARRFLLELHPPSKSGSEAPGH